MAWDVENRRDFAIEVYQTTLTSGSGGADAVVTTSQKVMGFLKQCFVEPDGVDVPTASWDLTLTDEPIDDGTAGPDLLNGQGTNLSETATTTLGPSDLKGGLIGVNKLKVTGKNMGNSKKAKVTIYIARFK